VKKKTGNRQKDGGKMLNFAIVRSAAFALRNKMGIKTLLQCKIRL
jgi:hypothetical protein